MNSDVQGKISVKMEEPSKTLPTYKDLNQNFKDLGLKDKVVLITGASRGIGATTARLFACQGAKVIVNYLASVTEAKKVVDDILANSGQAIAIKADVSKRNEVQALLTQAQKAFGGVDILVNNAATDFIATPFQSLTWDKIQKDIDVIVQGAFNCSQEVIPLMIQRKGGRIINVITHATEIPPVGHTKYVVAKSALVGLSRSLAVEYAGKNILVNMVVPSMVETDLTKTVPLAVREQIRHHNPLGRHPNTEDVAKAIVFLASSYSNYTTGQKFFVTGGLAPFN